MKKEIKEINEKCFLVYESRLKYAITKYKNSKSYYTIISITFSGFISFLSAFLTTYFTNNFQAWISVLVVAVFFLLISAFFGIKQLFNTKKGVGSEEWFISLIVNKEESFSKFVNPYDKKKKRFYIINAITIIVLPVIVLVSVLGYFGWNISKYNWQPIFWIIWSSISLLYIVFGTYINAWIAYLIFGFDAFDYLPNNDIF